MSIIDNPTARLIWLARVQAMVIEAQRLEQHISIGLLSQPTQQQRNLLMLGDIALGVAVKGLLEAADLIGRLP